MDEFFAKVFANETLTTGGCITAVICFVAYMMPKIINALKHDRNEGAGLDAEHSILGALESRVKSNEDEVISLRLQVSQTSAKVQAYAIQATRLQVLVIKLEGYLIAAGIDVPETVRQEIEALTKEQ